MASADRQTMEELQQDEGFMDVCVECGITSTISVSINVSVITFENVHENDVAEKE